VTALAINAQWSLLTFGALVPTTTTAIADRFTGAFQCTVPKPLALVTPKRVRDENIYLDNIIPSFDLPRERGTREGNEVSICWNYSSTCFSREAFDLDDALLRKFRGQCIF
jgi:hypothetical protein